jgi:hypothetical protein
VGAHADSFEQVPEGERCDMQHTQGSKLYHVTKLHPECPWHGRPENLSPEATARQREIAERKWS